MVHPLDANKGTGADIDIKSNSRFPLKKAQPGRVNDFGLFNVLILVNVQH